jgi:hypothetical protein
MNSTTPQLPHALPPPAIRRPSAARLPSRPNWGDVFDERSPLMAAPAFYGPPIIYVMAPWLLLVLFLIGPFVLVLTILVAMALTACLLAAFAAVIASPYLVIRRLRVRAATHAIPRTSAHLVRKYRASSRWLGSLQPKGMS